MIEFEGTTCPSFSVRLRASFSMLPHNGAGSLQPFLMEPSWSESKTCQPNVSGEMHKKPWLKTISIQYKTLMLIFKLRSSKFEIFISHSNKVQWVHFIDGVLQSLVR